MIVSSRRERENSVQGDKQKKRSLQVGETLRIRAKHNFLRVVKLDKHARRVSGNALER